MAPIFRTWGWLFVGTIALIVLGGSLCSSPSQPKEVWIPLQPTAKITSAPSATTTGSLGISLQRAEVWETGNALFQRTDGWTGADGVYTVDLGNSRILWLFADTWVGKVRDGKRTDATIVNNSVGIQTGRGTSTTMRFFWGRKADGKPDALILPKDGRGWFWMQAGVMVNQVLYLFLTQVIKTTSTGVFGFRVIGRWIAVVSNPQEEPTSWKIQQHLFPHTIFSDTREVTFGAAILSRDSYLYLYGTDEDINVQTKTRERYLVLARVPAHRLIDFTAWEFWSKGTWQRQFQQVTRLVSRMASELSVTALPSHDAYVLVYTEGGLSARVLARFAPNLEGPWSEAVELFRCPEMSWDQRVFCYNAKAHPLLATGHELIINYVANSFDFWHIVKDARLYWPRFSRIRLQYRYHEKEPR